MRVEAAFYPLTRTSCRIKSIARRVEDPLTSDRLPLLPPIGAHE